MTRLNFLATARTKVPQGCDGPTFHSSVASGSSTSNLRRVPAWLLLATLVSASAARAAPVQTEGGAYTRYELLAPATHKFRIRYAITATAEGATAYYNPVRPGSTASDEAVIDAATGKPLTFTEVDGAVAKAGGVADALPGNRFIAVTLARAVAKDGGGRIIIDKTYADAKSYYIDGDAIVFDRSLGIKRNSVVLPPGYRLTACNVPAQVIEQPDGRVAVSFLNATPAPMPLVLRARPGQSSTPPPSSLAGKITERAAQTREIVYYLQQPESHAFDLTHDYTETRAGTAAYVNIVRAGSRVSNPSARDLDTGAALPFATVHGAAVKAAEPDATDVTDDTTAVVFRFAPVRAGESRRLRIVETYTDAARYSLTGDELVWHRSFGRPANAVVLPAGWRVTNSSVPATVSEQADGRIRLDFVNARNDEIDVIITARRAS